MLAAVDTRVGHVSAALPLFAVGVVDPDAVRNLVRISRAVLANAVSEHVDAGVSRGAHASAACADGPVRVRVVPV